ncbi:MAG TPA: O-methyltransferase [Terracidiphilus sp.]|jgi:predicted O-methyltransferase YrrM|nr:O-methyltransferase [Terracidiphilus sp.]
MESADPPIWAQVDDYFSKLLAPADDKFDAALQANQQAGLPQIDVTALQGKFLEFLVRVSGARCILEIGALGGYSTLWLARALPGDGRIVTLELDPHHAEVARANLENAGVLDSVDLIVGPAIETLPTLRNSPAAPFDVIFIDADKQSYPEYLRWALKLSRPGTVIVADNVVRQGKVVDPDSDDPNVQGVRRFTELVAAEPRLSATVLQTVGVKGYDGFLLAVVLS